MDALIRSFTVQESCNAVASEEIEEEKVVERKDTPILKPKRRTKPRKN